VPTTSTCFASLGAFASTLPPTSFLVPRRKYEVEVPNAVNKLLAKQWDGGTVLLLPTALVRLHISGVHFSYQHWTTKAGKACGRCLCDAANAPCNCVPLNGLGNFGKQLIRDEQICLWGAIRHSTVSDLALMILTAVRKHGWGQVLRFSHTYEKWCIDMKLKGNFQGMSSVT
jgi:hypothetical protein